MKKILTTLTIVALLSIGLVPAVFAQQKLDDAFLPQGLPTLSGKTTGEALSADESRVLIVQRLVSVVMGTAGAVATIFIVISGLQLITSNGNDEGLGKAKKGITWAIVGLLAIIFSYSIVSYLIKVTLITDDPNADRSGIINNGPDLNTPTPAAAPPNLEELSNRSSEA